MKEKLTLCPWPRQNFLYHQERRKKLSTLRWGKNILANTDRILHFLCKFFIGRPIFFFFFFNFWSSLKKFQLFHISSKCLFCELLIFSSRIASFSFELYQPFKAHQISLDLPVCKRPIREYFSEASSAWLWHFWVNYKARMKIYILMISLKILLTWNIKNSSHDNTKSRW